MTFIRSLVEEIKQTKSSEITTTRLNARESRWPLLIITTFISKSKLWVSVANRLLCFEGMCSESTAYVQRVDRRVLTKRLEANRLCSETTGHPN